MREIKFRAWGKNIKEYISQDGVEPFDYTLKQISDGCIYCIDEYIIEQFTGLEDKNGKEIYEGDVVDVWIGGCKQDTSYVVEDIRELYSEFHHDDGYYQFNKVEVIGNIHENPELLEEEKE